MSQSKFNAMNVATDDFKRVRIWSATEGRPMYRIVAEALKLYAEKTSTQEKAL